MLRTSDAVFALDDWLRQRFGVYEFTDDPQCLFRIQCLCSDDAVELADGTRVRRGDHLLALHLWNEHIPLMGRGGPSLAWARRFDRAVQVSMRALAGYLAEHDELSDVGAICGDVYLGNAMQAAQFARIASHYGFESVGLQIDRRGLLRRVGDAIFMVMLVSATNTRALRSAPLRLRGARLWLSRGVLERYRSPVRKVRADGYSSSAGQRRFVADRPLLAGSGHPRTRRNSTGFGVTWPD